jgi:DNA-binding NarL/FixJ family response regulator
MNSMQTLSKLKVLVAEDHQTMRTWVTTFLQRDFEVVASVTNGRAAIEAANKLTPDILILDVLMPILNGTDAVSHLKLGACKAKIVFISASMATEQVKACFAAGGDACVSKMRMGTDLIYAIREVLAGRVFVSPETG